jgi:hypothetical protein
MGEGRDEGVFNEFSLTLICIDPSSNSKIIPQIIPQSVFLLESHISHGLHAKKR